MKSAKTLEIPARGGAGVTAWSAAVVGAWAGALDRALAGPCTSVLDELRAKVLRATRPWSGRLAGDRELRIAVAASATVLFSCVATLVAPLALLAIGPILLGIPHLLADVRYCVVRTGWSRDRALQLAAVPIAAVAFGASMSVGFIAVAAAIAASRAPARRRAIGVLVTLVLFVSTAHLGRWSDVAIVHLHNFVAVALWLAWRERRSRWHLVPLGLIGACSVVVWAWPFAWTFDRLAPTAIPIRHHLVALAPGLPEALALRLVLLFAFMQSVHYALWLRVVPEEDRDRETPRTFRASLQALDRDVGRWLVRLTLLVTVALAAWAVVDLFAARIHYLRLARFHAVLEFCVIALVLVERRTVSARRRDGLPTQKVE